MLIDIIIVYYAFVLSAIGILGIYDYLKYKDHYEDVINY